MQIKNNYDSGKSVAFPLHMRIVWLTVFFFRDFFASNREKDLHNNNSNESESISSISHSVPLFSVCLLRRSKHTRDSRNTRNIKRTVDQMLDENN